MNLSNLEVDEYPILKRLWSDEREFWESPGRSTRVEILMQLMDAGYLTLEDSKKILYSGDLEEACKQELIQKDREYFERIYDATLTWEDEGGLVPFENANKIWYLNPEDVIVKAGGNPPFKIPDTEDEDLWWIGSDSKISPDDIKVWKKPEHCTCAIPDWINVGVMSQLWHCKSCDRPKKEDSK